MVADPLSISAHAVRGGVEDGCSTNRVFGGTTASLAPAVEQGQLREARKKTMAY